MTQKNDLVLIYFKDVPTVFARVDQIDPDPKPGWYHVTLLFLQVPLQTMVWLLRDAQINGEEFTMDGNRIRMEKIPPSIEKPRRDEEKEEAKTPPASGKMISLSERRPKKNP
ncbi:conserved hypothetical protein [Candidatus Desulfarcum epimagneticum]|uniref:Uncharacterized protein n=1 Tax=uncultured Desulfobacteraceae bacterium TaxID=218296 RepID=A0A484HBG5_9BACT|nr:conserved hypothetical protein [uncultured Desulfobacteraceae bacterium]